MFCPKCGCQMNNGICVNCNQINNNYNQVYQQQPIMPQYMPPQNNKKNMTGQIIISVCISCALIIITFVYLMLSADKDKVYFSDDNNVNSGNEVNNPNNSTSVPPTENKKLGVTSINHENQYYLEVPTTDSSVLSKVREDSVSQKDVCSSKITAIENRIISNYKIKAVNLCELSEDFALELEKVIKYIYDEFPTARGYLTHISLGNMTTNSNTIAYFQWLTPFTYSSKDSYLGYKSRIILNSAYYLNEDRFKQSVVRSTTSGHFPKNATVYSPLAHEFAHYLSFIATNNYYNAEPRIIYDVTDTTAPYILALQDFGVGTHSKRMTEEAYQNYKNKTNTTLTFDEFRGSISAYALAKDDTGAYIYDETVAEAFHDVYLNGNNAADASKEIFNVLRKYLEM